MSLENSPYRVAAEKIFNKILEIPTSKSHANRALIVGALRGQSFKVHQVPESSDVKNLLSCFKSMGLRFHHNNSTVEFLNAFPACESEAATEVIDLFTGDGGTTNRFLIALLSRGRKTYRLFPTERMKERPIDDLIDPLKLLNVQINCESQKQDAPWIIMKGPATMEKTSAITIDCSKSTQFATAMVLAFSNVPLKVDFQNVEASALYLKLTEEVLKKSLEKNSYTVPVDFSSLGYPAVLAALYGELRVTNCLERDIYQADSILLEILQQAGAKVTFTSQGLQVQKHHNNTLKPFSVRVKDSPDLFPTLAFLAAHIDGISVFTDLEVLRLKESDRLKEMLDLLKAFKVPYEYDETHSLLKVNGQTKEPYPFASIKPPRDHRIVMTAYLFMRSNNGGELYETDCVEKSFPHFFTQLE